MASETLTKEEVERARMDRTIRDRTTNLHAIIRNAKSLAFRKRISNWSFVGCLFGVGSTYAREICIQAGISPDEMTIPDGPSRSERTAP